MIDWPTRTLDEVVELQRGHDLPSDQRRHGPVPIIGSFGVTGFHDVARYEGPGVGIGRSGASIGKATFVVDDYWPLNTCLFVKDFKGNDPRWVFWMLDQIEFEAFNSGSAQPSLNRNLLRSIPVLVPSRPEQQAIAEVLGALDDKIAASTALVSTLDSYAATLLVSALGQESSALGDLAAITMGSSPKGEDLNERGEGVPFFQGVRDFGTRTPTPRVFTTSPVRMSAADDILISVRAPVGDVNVTDRAVCIGRGIAAARSKSGRQATLFHQLRAEPEAWEPFEAEGTVFGSINRDQLHGVRLRTVAPGREAEVEDQLSDLEGAIAALILENRTLAATRDALLPQLMSGKLRVRDAERIAEEAGA